MDVVCEDVLPIHSSHFMLLNPIVMKYFGPYLNGRYGIGLVAWTSQSGYGEAVGLLKSEGIHSPGFLFGF
jgi:hypothetical protein